MSDEEELDRILRMMDRSITWCTVLLILLTLLIITTQF